MVQEHRYCHQLDEGHDRDEVLPLPSLYPSTEGLGNGPAAENGYPASYLSIECPANGETQEPESQAYEEGPTVDCLPVHSSSLLHDVAPDVRGEKIHEERGDDQRCPGLLGVVEDGLAIQYPDGDEVEEGQEGVEEKGVEEEGGDELSGVEEEGQGEGGDGEHQVGDGACRLCPDHVDLAHAPLGDDCAGGSEEDGEEQG